MKLIYAKFVPFGAQDLCNQINATGLVDRLVSITQDTPPPGYRGPVASFVFFRVVDEFIDDLPK